MAGLKVAIRVAGVNVQAHYLLNSPKIKNVEIVSKGTGNHKSYLKYLWTRGLFTKSFINNSLKRGEMKKRGDEIRSNILSNSGSLYIDKIEDDSTKRTYK
jgi:hypothetical protein